MRFGLLLLALVAAATAYPNITPTAVNKDLLTRQQQVILFLENPLGDIPDPHLKTIGKTYDIKKFFDKYDDEFAVKWLYKVVEAKRFHVKTIPFTIVRPEFRKLYVLLYRAFVAALDFESFMHIACWARTYLPVEYVFSAFLMAVIERPDTKGITLPPLSEIFPTYFFDSRYIQEAQNIRSMGYTGTGNKTYITPMKYMVSHKGKVGDLDYWYNDVELNQFFYYFYLTGLTDERKFEKRVDDTDYVKIVNGRGNQFLYTLREIFIRWEWERVSNYLPPFSAVDKMHVPKPFRSKLRYINGLEMTGRTTDVYNMIVNKEAFKYIDACEMRIADAIDMGYAISNKGNLVPLYSGPKGFEIFGNMIEGFGRSINLRYYGNCLMSFIKMFGGGYVTGNVFDPRPSVLENPATMLRDEIWYTHGLASVVGMMDRYQNALTPYTYADLFFDGVEIESFKISKLETFFEKYDVNIEAATHKNVYNITDKMEIKMVNKRLNHEPYVLKFVVNSKTFVKNAVFRVYAGLNDKYYYGNTNFGENRPRFILMDHFVYDVNQGKTVIERNSNEAPMRGLEPLPKNEIFRRNKLALDSHAPFQASHSAGILGFAERLALPKGLYEGLVLDWMVIASSPIIKNVTYNPVPPPSLDPYYEYNHYDSIKHEVASGKVFGTGYPYGYGSEHSMESDYPIRHQRSATEYTAGTSSWDEHFAKFHISSIAGSGVSIDGRPLGFPFDRRMDTGAYYVPNMKFTTAKVYLKDKFHSHDHYGTTVSPKSSEEHVG